PIPIPNRDTQPASLWIETSAPDKLQTQTVDKVQKMRMQTEADGFGFDFAPLCGINALLGKPMSIGQHWSKQPRSHEANLMALVLEGRHGAFASDIAEFFAALHIEHGDAERSKAWTRVARLVREREYER